mmetsp:Transcript_14255/g.22203  ORF Transcript_14255/g.22203 Transcript_14255/m.22203 type:complete len:119 (+) Transcript_14255:2596-2952(+)
MGRGSIIGFNSVLTGSIWKFSGVVRSAQSCKVICISADFFKRTAMTEKRVAKAILAMQQELEMQGVPSIDYLISRINFSKEERAKSLLAYKKYEFYASVCFDPLVKEASDLITVTKDY